MPQTVNNTNNNSSANVQPSIRFSHDEDTRGRDHVAHPISEPKPTDMAPLTKTLTTESSKSRRSSLLAFAERLRSRSSSRSQSPRSSLDVDRNHAGDGYKYSRRRSSDIGGEYADVIRAQALFMDKLREDQARSHITHNVDGLPIPPPVERERRRSSLTRALGMDKPLLAR